MPPGRARGGFRGRGRGGSRGRGRGGQRNTFTTARIQDPVSDDESEQGLEHDDSPSEVSDVENEVSSDDEATAESGVRPYNALLQSFQQSATEDQPRRKRRKIEHEPAEDGDAHSSRQSTPAPHELTEVKDSDVGSASEAEDEPLEDAGFIDDDEDASDPFEIHFSSPDEEELGKKVKDASSNQWALQKIPLGALGKGIFYSLAGSGPSKRPTKSLNDLKLKKKLVEPAQKQLAQFDELDQALAPFIFDYTDVLFGARTVKNAENLRKLACLHALNHLFKTRDRVIKNNARLTKEEDGDLELRDQGFTRPKVLMLLETRQSCARMVDTITALVEPEQQEHKKRFQDSFVVTEQKFGEDKPEDFRELFEGNDDNEFRLGMKFTRKTVKFFSQFYNSDIIFASPLGLRRAIEGAGPKKMDFDFLSSIEVVIMDQADAMLMQNWEHVEYVYQHLNLQPKDAHGCDFSRVRHWYLDGNAKYLRQTIILSAFLTPELNSLFNKQMHNVAGKLKYQPEYEGAIMEIGLQVKQTFSRFDSPSPAADPDARFKYFTSAIIPALNRYPKAPEGGQGILIFIPSYLDFVRLRNYFAASQATQHISFGAISEYTEPPDMRRARSHFLTGRHSVLLYTGRAHHFRRYLIRGVKRVIMYALPDNPIFYSEIVGGFLGTTIGEGKLDPLEASVRVLFSKWDGLRLERVVGTKRVGSMLKDKSGDTFDFV